MSQQEQIRPEACGTRTISIFRSGRIGRTAQQAVAGILTAAMVPISLGTAFGQYQDAPPPPPDYGNQGGPPPSNYQPLGPDQIDQLVAPIALYPDSLVAQVLTAATYPAQLASAEQFVQGSGNYPPDQLAQMANEQPWDPSVKSLVAFPQVLSDMNRNMDWTTQLGNVYYNQPQDVLGAVQDMRQRAYAAGNLRSTPQLAVQYAPGDIVIQPVSPAVVYVPYYNPWVVYGAPIPAYAGYYYGPPRGIAFGAGLAIGFGLGIAIGAFTHFGWGYHNWAPDWRGRSVYFNHTTYISRSNTVINHGNFGRYNGFQGRGGFNGNGAARFNSGNRTVNNVPVNRGPNAYNNGSTVNRGANTFNRGGQIYNGNGSAYNRGAATSNGAYNRGAAAPSGAYNRDAAAPSGAYNRGTASPYTQGRGNTPAPQANTARPQFNGNGGGGNQGNARPAAQQQQQRSAPAQAPRGGGGDHGGGHGGGGGDHGGGGGHDDHHH